jgi:hypothetical protein
MYDAAAFDAAVPVFREVMDTIRSGELPDHAYCHVIPRVIYTAQQSIGATLDALLAGASNRARKLNGDLFEHFIKTLIEDLGVDCTSGTIKVPVKDDAGNVIFCADFKALSDVYCSGIAAKCLCLYLQHTPLSADRRADFSRLLRVITSNLV